MSSDIPGYQHFPATQKSQTLSDQLNWLHVVEALRHEQELSLREAKQ